MAPNPSGVVHGLLARQEVESEILQEAGEEGGQESSSAYRALLLAHSQWLENFHRAGRDEASLCDEACEYRQGRTIRARLSQNLAQQPHAGDRRSRWPGRTSHLGVRIRRHPAIS